MNTLRRKLSSRRGVTLTEVLSAVAVMSLVTLAMAVGINASLRIYRESVAISEAQTLSSTLAQALMDELRYARDIEADEEGLLEIFTSNQYGEDVTIAVNEEGQLAIGGELLVGSGAYSSGRFKVSAANVTYSGGEKKFDVELTISDRAAALRTITFSVVPLN